jgi:hypothetical protein
LSFFALREKLWGGIIFNGNTIKMNGSTSNIKETDFQATSQENAMSVEPRSSRQASEAGTEEV